MTNKMKITKSEALAKIKELQIELIDKEKKWATIDYFVISKDIFDLYGAKPFNVMKKKMRDSKGEVWANITWGDAKDEASKLGFRLLKLQELLVLLHVYKQKYPDNADVNHNEFLGIEELSYEHEVCYEWIESVCPCVRGGAWSDGSDAGAFTASLAWGTGDTNGGVGFRMAQDL